MEEEITAFRQAEGQTRDVRELKRLQAVRLYATGASVDTIQKLVGCGPASPRQWAIEYRRGGLTALKSHWAVDNAKKLSEEQRVFEETKATFATGGLFFVNRQHFQQTEIGLVQHVGGDDVLTVSPAVDR